MTSAILRPPPAVLLLLALTSSGGCSGEGPAAPPPVSRTRFLTVAPDGGARFLSVQAAIDSAVAGDTVAVAGGTYPERLLIEKPLVLLGGWSADFAGRDAALHETILDGCSEGTVVTVSCVLDTTLRIDGFTVTGGGPGASKGERVLRFSAPPGSGIYLRETSAVISGNVVRGNEAPYGAGILCHRGSARLRRNLVLDNRATESGGGILCLEFSGSLERNLVAGNHAGREGGGISLSGSEAELGGDRVAANESAGDGGGIVCRFSTVLFDSVGVDSNVAGGEGGGILVAERGASQFERCRIFGNRAQSRGGGACCIENAQVVFSRCTLSDNGSDVAGGALFAAAQVLLEECCLTRNEAPSGGALTAGDGARVEVRRSLFLENSARLGGGVTTEGGSEAEFTRNTFFGQRAPEAGGTFYLVGGSVHLEGNLVIGSAEGEGLFCWSEADLEMVRNDVWNHAGGDFGGACAEPAYPDPAGNLSEDPRFCDPDAGNFRLEPGSPAQSGADTLGAFPCGCDAPGGPCEP